jgi:alpha-mannosidase
LSEFGYGVALLNDSKYGYDVNNSVIRMTLIKSGIFPNPDADKEIHKFTYALFPHEGDFRQARVIQEAYDLNCPLYVLESKAEQNRSEQAYSLFTLDSENIFADTVKKAEDNDDIIIRIYEAYGKRTKVKLDYTNMKSREVWECDLMENNEKAMEIEKFSIAFEIKPYEIKTFRFVK